VLKKSNFLNRKTASGLGLLVLGAAILISGLIGHSNAAGPLKTSPQITVTKSKSPLTKSGQVLGFNSSSGGSLSANTGLNTAAAVSSGSPVSFNNSDSPIDPPPTVICHIYDACGAQPADQEQGIYGTITRGPLTPVCRIDIACDGPYSTTIVASNSEGEVSRFTSDEQGRFWVSLPAGAYILSPLTANRFSWMTPQSVTVTAGLYTEVNIQFDTGIR